MVRRRRNRWADLGAAVLAVAVIVTGTWLTTRTPPLDDAAGPGPTASLPSTTATVVWVADGDTLDVRLPGSDAATRVRLLAIDAPEGPSGARAAQCLADDARAALLDLAPRGSQVQLTDYGRDRFGRRLAGLTTTDGVLVNAELVRRGLAAPLVVGGDARLQPQVRAAQAEAAASGVGLHAATGCTIRGRLATADAAQARAVLDELLAPERNALVQGLTPQARDQAIRDARALAG